LAAVQIGPTLALARLSIAAYRSDWIEARAGVPLEVLLSLIWPNAHGVFDPATYNQPYDLTFMFLYCGLLALILAVAGVSKRSAVFAGMAVVSCGFMEGSWERLVWMPDFVRGSLYPQYAAAVFVLSLAVLAAYGLERLVRQQRWQWAAVAVCAADLILISSGRPMNAMPLAQEPGITYEHFQGSRETIVRTRALVGTEWRIDTTGNTQSWAALAPVTKIASANGYDPMALKRTMQVRLGFTTGERWGAYYEVEQPGSPLLDMLSVRFLISREKLDLPWAAHEVPGFTLYENADALVGRTRTAASPEAARSILTSPDFSSREEAIVEGAHRAPGATGQVRVLRYTLNEVELETDAEGSSYLVSSETHYPGWRAWLDGREQAIHYTNVAFRGMEVPAGRHRILWRFDPPLLGWCGALSLAGWLVWLLLWRRVSGKIPA
jgi:NADH:ubiquinone oxidoreductase subunit 6 (subunit J)